MSNRYQWYKDEETDTIMWLDNPDILGEHVFSFDNGETQFNLFSDYPWKLTPEQKEIFDRENPFWADFFKWREYNGKE